MSLDLRMVTVPFRRSGSSRVDTSIEAVLDNNRPGLFVYDKRREMILQIFQVERTRKYILANQLGLCSERIGKFFPAGRG